MKRRLIISSAVLALLSMSLCGCTDREPAKPLAEPISSMTSSEDKSVPESLPESSPESTSESTASESESVPQSVSKYPVQNAPSYTVTATSYEKDRVDGAAIYTYDEHGNMIKMASKFKNYYYAYEYNDDGTVRVKYSDGYREEYEYENGLEVKCTKYGDLERVVCVTTRTYDEHGYATSMTQELLGSTDGYTSEHEYDENGFLIKEILYDKNGELLGVGTYVYGENGEVLSGTMEKAGGLFSYDYKYDENGREVELHSTYSTVSLYGENVTQEKRAFTEYDEQGRISRVEEYSLDGGERLVSRKEYDYL